jgi:hypothetical protein
MYVRNVILALMVFALLAGTAAAAPADSLKQGTPDVKSAGPLAFGPDGILFMGDPMGAAIFAFDTGDTRPTGGNGKIRADSVNTKIAAMLGTEAKDILINDLAVNPASGNVYFSVSRGTGPSALPVIVRLDRGGKLGELSLKDVKFAKAMLPNPPVDNPNARGGSPRRETITDLAFVNGRVYIAGLSNEEFASKLRSIPFPFTDASPGTSVEIYHGAHGQFETRSPVRTFAPYKIAGEDHLLAAYTCTPLVKFPVNQLQPGQKVRGTTIAELGNMNRPLDIIIYQKGGKDYAFMANSARGVMKIQLENAASQEGITTKIGGGGKAGLPYETIAELKGVEQLDKLDDKHAVLLVRAGAVLNLQTIELP